MKVLATITVKPMTLEDGNVPAGSVHDPGQQSNVRPSILSEELEETPVKLFKHLIKSYE